MDQHERFTRAFGEWTRRYLEEPERFDSEWPAAEDEGGVRDWAERQALYFERLLLELGAGEAVAS